MGQLISDQQFNNQKIGFSNISNDMFNQMEKAYKFSQIMAKSDLIPVHYRNKTENVFIAIQTAYRMNLDPMLVMQNTFTIAGRLGMNSSFAISLANSSGLFNSGIRYRIEGCGQDLKVTAYTSFKNDKEEISYTIGMKEAIAENWIKNPKYKSMPELMLRYRAATLLIRTHAPEVINGMHMVEEIEDISYEKKLSKIPKLNKVTNIVDNFLQNENDNKQNTDHSSELFKSNFVELEKLIIKNNISDEIIKKWCKAGEVSCLNELDHKQISLCIQYIQNNNQ